MRSLRPASPSRPPRPSRQGGRFSSGPTGLAVDAVLGAVAALGLQPFGIWAATPLALAVLIWRLARRGPRGSVAHGMAAGVGWFALALFWIAEPFLVEPEIFGWMAPFAVLLMALGGALFWALPIAAAARIAPHWRARAVAIAAALALSDWLRGWIFTGFPWAQVGQVWIDTPVAQLAAWAGAPGLSALTLGLAALPVLAHRPGRAAALPGAIAAIAVLGGAWAAGLSRLAAPLPPDRDLVLRIVQPNATQALKWDPDWSRVFYDRLIDLSSAPGRRDAVIWPETAVNFLLDDAGGVLPVMAAAADAPLILGIQRRDGARWLNSLAVIDRAGAVAQVYDKFHLVPFGEYMPWGDALARIGITAFAAQAGNGYSAGPGPRVLGAPGLPDFQPLICYEAIFPQHLRGLPTRPGWLLQATNDAWFGKFSGPYQHLAQARLRAIETGLPMVRAANTGISAVIDARGTLRESLPLNEAGAIDAALPGALPETPWLRLGNGPLVAALAALLALCALWRRVSRG